MGVNIKAELFKRDEASSLYQGYSEMFGIKPELKITEIQLDLTVPYSKHPFKVVEGEKLDRLTEDIKANGLNTPIIVRKFGFSDKFEVLSGHRRVTACKKAGMDKVNGIVVQANDDEAARIVVNSNFMQRDEILPSEKARSFMLRNEYLKVQKMSTQKSPSNTDDSGVFDEFSPGGKIGDTYQILEEEYGEGKTNIFRYIRLNFLTDSLLNLVDSKALQLKSAVELSYLNEDDQETVYKFFFEENAAKLSQNLSADIRKRAQETKKVITSEWLQQLVDQTASKSRKFTALTLKGTEFKKYAGHFSGKTEMQQTIMRLLDEYVKSLD